MSYQAIIDLGSNTIRLCIYHLDSFALHHIKHHQAYSWDQNGIHISLNYKVMAGLASFVTDGVMSKQGIKKATKTINDHLIRASHFGCDRPENVHIFATAVLRNCLNSEEAKHAIEEGCEFPITILSNKEEAHLGFVGAGLDSIPEAGVLVDIGGGSTELTVFADGVDHDNVSLPQGSLSSYARFVEGVLPTPREMEAIECAFKEKLATLDKTRYQAPTLCGIGGIVRSVAKLYGDMCNDGKRITTITREHLEIILAAYGQNPNAFAHTALKTIPDRIHTFVPGCIILRRIFLFCGAETLTVCKHGLREGCLIDKILLAHS